jgi:ribosomal protein L11 methyltransferase
VGATRVEQQVQTDQDWQAKYRQMAEPIDVGDGFVLDPREPGSATDGTPAHDDEGRSECRSDRQWLKLPARQAFGTGSHETTQLMVEGMERLDLAARSVLDVGVGSGVLSLVARVLGADRILACDIDLLSALATRDNAMLNRLEAPQLFVGKVDVLASPGHFDCVLVNVLEDRIADSVTTLQALVAPGGDLLMSGCLAENRERVERLWQTSDLRVVDRREKRDWLLLHLQRIRDGGGTAPCRP